METLITSLLNNIPEQRLTCDQILSDQTWRYYGYYGHKNEEIMSDKPDHFLKKYFKEKLLYFNLLGTRYKILENIGEGCVGNAFKIQNESDKGVFAIKKIQYGMKIK